MKTTEIPASRRKTLLYLCMCLAFVAPGLWLDIQPRANAAMLQLATAFFGLGALVFVWILIRPHRLLLDDEGFTLTGGFKRSPVKLYWRDIDEFFVYRVSRCVKTVGFNYKPGLREQSRLSRINRLFGADGALPQGWVLSSEQMVDELNSYRLRMEGRAVATFDSVSS